MSRLSATIGWSSKILSIFLIVCGIGVITKGANATPLTPGIGLSLELPKDYSVHFPTDISPITLVTVFGPGDVDRPDTKVEIYAEKLPQGLSYEDWQKIYEDNRPDYGRYIISETVTTINGIERVSRTVGTDYGEILETEFFIASSLSEKRDGRVLGHGRS